MKITVEYAAQVKKAAGKAADSIEVPDETTAQEVVRQIAKVHGEGFSHLILTDDNQLHPSILLFVGDDQIAWETPTPLRDRDVVTILSPVSGG